MAKDYSKMTEEELTQARNELDEQMKALRNEKFKIQAVMEQKFSRSPVGGAHELKPKGIESSQKFGKPGG